MTETAADVTHAQASGAATVRAPRVAAALVVGALAVSSSGVLIRVADAPSLSIAFWRCFGGAVALAPFALRARHRLGRLDRRQRWQLVGAGLCLALHFALFISSLSFTTVASAVLFATMSPLFVGLGAAVFLGEPPLRRTWVGIGVTMLGAVAVGLADLGDVDLGSRAVLGDAMALASAIAVTGYLLLGRVVRQTLPNSVYAASVYGVAAATLLIASIATGASLTGYDAPTWGAIIALIVGPQLLGHTVFNWVLSSVTPTVVAVTVLSEPVGAGVLAWLVLSEVPSTWFWFGAPLILAGVYLAATARRPLDPEELSPAG